VQISGKGFVSPRLALAVVRRSATLLPGTDSLYVWRHVAWLRRAARQADALSSALREWQPLARSSPTSLKSRQGSCWPSLARTRWVRRTLSRDQYRFEIARGLAWGPVDDTHPTKQAMMRPTLLSAMRSLRTPGRAWPCPTSGIASTRGRLWYRDHPCRVVSVCPNRHAATMRMTIER
jgi:hypothetical protein